MYCTGEEEGCEVMKSVARQTTASIPRSSSRADQYATAGEFCKIFLENMESLYTLALALTADKVAAEACLLSALEECKRTASVFRQWAHSWSRLAVIESAIRVVRPTANDVGDNTKIGDEIVGKSDSPADFVSKLRAFDRFTFVLSVLDRYSVRDCAILLKCRPHEIQRARLRALELMGKAGNFLVAPAQPNLGARLTA
jgi:hypothetical protein